MSSFEFMEFHATRQKVKNFELFSFPIEGKKIFDIATVSHLRRGEDGDTEGFQRPEVRAHIRNIAEYIENPDSMIPNAIVLAIYDSNFSFTKISSYCCRSIHFSISYYGKVEYSTIHICVFKVHSPFCRNGPLQCPQLRFIFIYRKHHFFNCLYLSKLLRRKLGSRLANRT